MVRTLGILVCARGCSAAAFFPSTIGAARRVTERLLKQPNRLEVLRELRAEVMGVSQKQRRALEEAVLLWRCLPCATGVSGVASCTARAMVFRGHSEPAAPLLPCSARAAAAES